MKSGYNQIEKALLDKHLRSDDLLHLKMGPPDASGMARPLPSKLQNKYFVREFGCVQHYEAVYELGLDMDDMTFMQWTAFDQGDSKSVLVAQMRTENGYVVGFLEKVYCRGHEPAKSHEPTNSHEPTHSQTNTNGHEH